MLLPDAAVSLAKTCEGLARIVRYQPAISVCPYVCPAGYWTIAYGHLCAQDQPMVDEHQADAWLDQDMQNALSDTVRLCPVLLTEPEARLAAIVDFTFNLGGGRLQASTLRRRVNQRDWAESRNELRRWVYGGGRKLPGLIARREAEAALL